MNENVSTTTRCCLIRPFLLLVIPLITGILELWHPVGFGKDVYHLLLPKAHWWFQLHLTQLVLFGLMGVAGLLLLKGHQGFLVRVSWIGFWIFMVFYAAFDSIAGISVGAIMLDSQSLSPANQEVVAQVVQKLYHNPIVGGSHSWLSETASAGWVIGLVPAIIVLARAGAPWISLVAFAVSAVSLWWSHAYPYGPIGFVTFFIGALFLLRWERGCKTQCSG